MHWLKRSRLEANCETHSLGKPAHSPKRKRYAYVENFDAQLVHSIGGFN